jgi:hypothetical protein
MLTSGCAAGGGTAGTPAQLSASRVETNPGGSASGSWSRRRVWRRCVRGARRAKRAGRPARDRLLESVKVCRTTLRKGFRVWFAVPKGTLLLGFDTWHRNGS